MRSCHPEGAYTVDWNGLREIVVVSGHAIFEGDMVMTGIHWSSGAVRSSGHVVDALGPAGMGIVAYEVRATNPGLQQQLILLPDAHIDPHISIYTYRVCWRITHGLGVCVCVSDTSLQLEQGVTD